MNFLKNLFAVPDLSNRTSAALLLLRFVFGSVMAMHGLGKIKNPLHWMDKAARPAPSILQAAAAVSEFFGGIAIAIGLLTPAAAFGIICTMAVAIYSHKSKGDGIMPTPGRGTYELALVHLTAVLTTLVAGPGKFSIDALLFRKKR